MRTIPAFRRPSVPSMAIVIAVATMFNARESRAIPAADSNSVLILADTVSGGAASIEATKAAALGYTVEVATAAQWGAATAAQFATYRGLILGDPTCGGSDALAPAEANRGVWSLAVVGNVVVVGTDPTYHSSFGPGGAQGGDEVTERGIAFAASGSGTGLYVTLSCYYHGAFPTTPVAVLDQFGTFTVTGVGCYNDAHIVALHPALAGLSDANLSNWSCSVHEAFDSFPVSFTPLAIAENISGPGSLTFPDGTFGIPYIVAKGASPVSCGDTVVQVPEQCDDGNTAPGDGCSELCRFEICGDGIPNVGEQCDDGNTTPGDGCSDSCTLERCGNDDLDVGEQCDDGNTTPGDGCSDICRFEICGDGIDNVGEQCDDGNTTPGDGCSSTCQLEGPGCGDGTIDPTEQCDDGNTADGDCCSADCQTPSAAGTLCEADGSLCTNDQCDGAGTCVFLSDVTCQPSSPPCEGGELCNPATGACEAQPDLPTSTPCEADGDLCTVDHCDGGGSCVLLSTATCTALDQCHTPGTCDPGSGACSNPNKPDGQVCDDSNFCTQRDQCVSGVCSGDITGADTDADGYCDLFENQVGCDASDSREIPPQAPTYGGSGSNLPNVLVTYSGPSGKHIRVASDPSCATVGVCGAPPAGFLRGFCTAGRIGDACSSNAECNLPPGTCRLVAIYADVPDLALSYSSLNRLRNQITGFDPAQAGCSRKVDVLLDAARPVNRVRIRAEGTVFGRFGIDRDTFTYR